MAENETQEKKPLELSIWFCALLIVVIIAGCWIFKLYSDKAELQKQLDDVTVRCNQAVNDKSRILENALKISEDYDNYTPAQVKEMLSTIETLQISLQEAQNTPVLDDAVNSGDVVSE